MGYHWKQKTFYKMVKTRANDWFETGAGAAQGLDCRFVLPKTSKDQIRVRLFLHLIMQPQVWYGMDLAN